LIVNAHELVEKCYNYVQCRNCSLSFSIHELFESSTQMYMTDKMGTTKVNCFSIIILQGTRKVTMVWLWCWIIVSNLETHQKNIKQLGWELVVEWTCSTGMGL